MRCVIKCCICQAMSAYSTQNMGHDPSSPISPDSTVWSGRQRTCILAEPQHSMFRRSVLYHARLRGEGAQRAQVDDGTTAYASTRGCCVHHDWLLFLHDRRDLACNQEGTSDIDAQKPVKLGRIGLSRLIRILDPDLAGGSATGPVMVCYSTNGERKIKRQLSHPGAVDTVIDAPKYLDHTRQGLPQ